MVDFLLLSHPRSGSSALRHEMNRSAAVVIPPEAGFATWLTRDPVLRKAEDNPGGTPFEELFVSALARTRKFEHWQMTEESVRRRLRATGVTAIRPAIDEVYRLFRDRVRPNASFIGDKNNSYFFEVEAALHALRPAKVVLLWRDPVEVWSSYQRLRRDRARDSALSENPYFPPLPRTREGYIHEWNRGHEMAMESLDEWAGPTRYCSYHSLVSDGVRVTEELVEFVTGASAQDTVVVPEALREPEDLRPWKRGVDLPLQRRELQESAEEIRSTDAAEIRERTRAVQQELDGRSR